MRCFYCPLYFVAISLATCSSPVAKHGHVLRVELVHSEDVSRIGSGAISIHEPGVVASLQNGWNRVSTTRLAEVEFWEYSRWSPKEVRYSIIEDPAVSRLFVEGGVYFSRELDSHDANLRFEVQEPTEVRLTRETLGAGIVHVVGKRSLDTLEFPIEDGERSIDFLVGPQVVSCELLVVVLPVLGEGNAEVFSVTIDGYGNANGTGSMPLRFGEVQVASTGTSQSEDLFFLDGPARLSPEELGVPSEFSGSRGKFKRVVPGGYRFLRRAGDSRELSLVKILVWPGETATIQAPHNTKEELVSITLDLSTQSEHYPLDSCDARIFAFSTGPKPEKIFSADISLLRQDDRTFVANQPVRVPAEIENRAGSIFLVLSNDRAGCIGIIASLNSRVAQSGDSSASSWCFGVAPTVLRYRGRLGESLQVRPLLPGTKVPFSRTLSYRFFGTGIEEIHGLPCGDYLVAIASGTSWFTARSRLDASLSDSDRTNGPPVTSGANSSVGSQF
jgi:hypothetical protein